MRTPKFLLAAAAASVMSTASFAADLGMPPPSFAPPLLAPPPPVVEFGGWYLRGDIGFSNQRVKDIHYGRESAYTSLTSFNQTSAFNSAGIFGLGVGYQVNNWLRADVTAQYRGNSNFTATDLFNGTAGGTPYKGIDNYGGSKSEWVVLANGYVDLGTWWCVTPFIGAGIGGARVSINGFTDTGANTLPGSTVSFASAPSDSKWNFAWAAHAGMSYKVAPDVVVELAYSYLDMGTGYTGVLTAFDGTTTNNVFKFKEITSQDLKLGVRWSIDPGPSYVPQMLPPLIRKG